MKAYGADLGIAWDGDFDRCFLYDHDGRFIEGYYLVGLIAQAVLREEPGATILYDPRLTWNTIDVVGAAGGVAKVCRTGHAFFKQMMRQQGAAYGGEMSAHHYFRTFSYCDSGMLAWLAVVAELSTSGTGLAEMVEARIGAFPCSGEINFKVPDAPAVQAPHRRPLHGCRPEARDDRRAEHGVRRLAVQPQGFEHGTAAETECRDACRCSAAGSKGLRAFGTDPGLSRWRSASSLAAVICASPPMLSSYFR